MDSPNVVSVLRGRVVSRSSLIPPVSLELIARYSLFVLWVIPFISYYIKSLMNFLL